jgi:hypothetical protein
MHESNHKYAVLDTNTLMHFRPPEEVNWHEVLDAKAVTIVLMPVVIRELDRHKDLHPNKRLRKRAGTLVSKLRKLLPKHGNEQKLREGVTVLFVRTEPMVDFRQHQLSSDLNDDRLIASILQLRHDHPNAQVVLVTSDFGLTIKAGGHHQVEVTSLPDELKLPEEPDEEQKQLRELQTKLAAHENRSPKLRLVFPEPADRLEIIRTNIAMPTEATIKEEVDKVRTGLTLHTGLTILDKISPAEERQYYESVEEYCKSYESYIRERHEAEAIRARTFSLDIYLSNQGTAPGDDMDVILRFPPGLEVLDEEPVQPEPERPTPPPRPVSSIFAHGALARIAVPTRLFDISTFASNSALLLSSEAVRAAALMNANVSGLNLSKAPEGHEVQVHVRRIKQNQSESLGTIYGIFASQESFKSFQIKYVIQAANIPNEVTGTLAVIVKDA